MTDQHYQLIREIDQATGYDENGVRMLRITREMLTKLVGLAYSDGRLDAHREDLERIQKARVQVEQNFHSTYQKLIK